MSNILNIKEVSRLYKRHHNDEIYFRVLNGVKGARVLTEQEVERLCSIIDFEAKKLKDILLYASKEA